MRCIDVENYPGFETIKSAPLEYAIGKAFKAAEAKTEAYEQDKVAQAVDRLKTEGADSDAGVTFNEDGTVYEGPGYLIPINENETTTVALSVNNIKRLIKRYGNKGPYVKVHIKKHARDPNKPYQPDKVTVSYNVIVPKDKAHLAQIIAKVAGRKYLINTEGSLAINVENPRKGITKRLALSGARLKDLQASLTAGELPKFIVDEYNKMGLDHHINKYGQKIAKPEPKPKAKPKPKPKPQPKPKEKPAPAQPTKPETPVSPDQPQFIGDVYYDDIVFNNITPEARKLFIFGGLPAGGIKQTLKRAHYSPYGQYIQLDKNDKSEQGITTAIHEYGHYLDHLLGGYALDRGEFKSWTELYKKSYISFAKLKAAFIKDAREAGLQYNNDSKHRYLDDAENDGPKALANYNRRKQYLSNFVSYVRRLRGGSNYHIHGISDIIDAMTRGYGRRIFHISGHGEKTFKVEGKRYTEAFANLFAMWADKDRKGWEEVQQRFPNLAAAFEEIMNEKLREL